jgi:hypothetical protein
MTKNNNNTSWPLKNVQPLTNHKCSTSNETQNHKLKHRDEERNNYVIFFVYIIAFWEAFTYLNQPLT